MLEAQQSSDHFREAFQRSGWLAKKPRSGAPAHASLIVEREGKAYVAVRKVAADGRSSLVIPLLAQSILEARLSAAEMAPGAVPVAVVEGPKIMAGVVAAAREFAARVAPDVAIGLIDAEGLREFSGHGLEVLNARPAARERRLARKIGSSRPLNVFSDRNQWMLKLLLAQRLPEGLLSAPQEPYRNATQLARAAGVSIMSAFRLLRQLGNDGFVDSNEEEYVKLVRVPELLHRWAAQASPVQELPVRWLIRRDRGALAAMLQAHAAERPGRGKPAARACLGLFAAADALGYGFVHGVPPHLYVEHVDGALLQKFGMTLDGAEQRPDAYLRIPANPEAVFRAAVVKDGVPVADILQVWLDVQSHPSRGKAAAAEIGQRVLAPLLKKK
ncbi:MAG: hypothetical protein JNK87_15430 [Bryobacterales bacterium]|nr:hypothetical protein [Bryobacterales bacterium]